jgi:CheY-like chemotaxis protein
VLAAQSIGSLRTAAPIAGEELARDSRRARAAGRDGRGTKGMKKKILMVDDSKTSIFLERTILHNAPYELIEAGDGEEAVEKAVAERPDLVLMDMMMPKMNGLEALQRLRELEATRSIPVIMVTTRSEADKVDAAFGLGCNDYVTKPIDQATLLKKIRKLLDEAGERADG